MHHNNRDINEDNQEHNEVDAKNNKLHGDKVFNNTKNTRKKRRQCLFFHMVF